QTRGALASSVKYDGVRPYGPVEPRRYQVSRLALSITTFVPSPTISTRSSGLVPDCPALKWKVPTVPLAKGARATPPPPVGAGVCRNERIGPTVTNAVPIGCQICPRQLRTAGSVNGRPGRSGTCSG